MVWVDASIKVLFHLCFYISPVFSLSCSQTIKDITYIYQKTFKSFKKQGKFTPGLYWCEKKNPKLSSAYYLCKLLDFKAWGRFSVTHSHIKNPQSFCKSPSALAKLFLSSRMGFPCTRELAHGISLVVLHFHPFAFAITPSTPTSLPASYCFLSPMVLKRFKIWLKYRLWVIQH